LSEQNNDFVAPIRKKDANLARILVLAAAVPVLMGIVGMIAPTLTTSDGMGSKLLHVEDYQDNPEVSAWLNKCNEDTSKTYALRYKIENDNRKETYFLVYRPTENGFYSTNFSMETGRFNTHYYDVKYSENHSPSLVTQELIYLYSYNSGYLYSNYATLRVFVDDKQIDCEITDVDYNPGRYYLPFSW